MNQQIDKNTLVSLGIKHGLLNWVEHDTPPNFFVRDMGEWLDERKEFVTATDAYELYNLLCAIYAEVGIV